MTAIDNIINQIEGETQNRGNTKTRIAAVLRLLRDKIVGLFSTKLDKGSYTGTADDLRTSIDGKVDKVPGKILSTNDFTNELRTKLEGLRNVDISGLLPKGGYTGTAQNLKELIDNIMRILQSPDTELDELREIVAYIKQNKRILDTLGISNIAGLQDALRGKAPTDHHHDDRYSRLGHTHTEYAYRTHRHRWDDIDGKPSLNFAPLNHTHSWNDITGKPSLNFAPLGHSHNWSDIDGKPSMDFAPRSHRHNWSDIDGKPALATEGKIQEEIRKIQVGGRNLLKNSGIKITNNNYLIATYDITTELKEGETVTLTIKGQLGAGKNYFQLYNSGANVVLSELENKGNGFYQKTFNWKVKTGVYTASNKKLYVFTIHNDVIVNSTIEWIKLERGNTPTDWTPAPEDLLVSNNARASSSIILTHAHNNATIFLEGITGVDMTGLEDLDSVSFRKCFATGHVNFATTNGKQIIYTGDSRNMQEGGEGSTAVVSVYGNKIYVDIRNV